MDGGFLTSACSSFPASEKFNSDSTYVAKLRRYDVLWDDYCTCVLSAEDQIVSICRLKCRCQADLGGAATVVD